MKMQQFWAQFPKWEFFSENLLMSLFLSFMPVYMPKIKVRHHSISETLTITEYWNLIGRGPFLAITWELYFFQACSFRRMLMNHKNFHFTQKSDKTNDVILLKSTKTMLWGQSWPFLFIFARGNFFKKSGSVTHDIWVPNTMHIFRKK